MAFFIFFSIVIIIYSLVNYYIFSRGLQALPAGSVLRAWYIPVFWTLAATYIAGRFLERVWLGPVSDALVWTGSFWLGAMLYFFLLVVLVDIFRVVNHFIPIIPAFARENFANFKLWLLGGSVLLVALMLVAGYINALNPRIKTVEINIPKHANGLESLNAVVMSDIHLGTMIGNGRLERIVNKANGLNPDIILLPGDILDEDLEPVIRQNAGATLKQLSAPMGVFGVMGNHEYIGGPEPAYRYLSEHGIIMLRDSLVNINNSFILVGREDFQKGRFAGEERQSIEELMEGVDQNLPVIVLDHQPFHPEMAAAAGADLMLSGHTHNGQLWPLNYIIDAMYVIGYGLGQVDGMHMYVSNGVGTWGPPLRIGNRPEIVHLKIKFGKN
ncbi:MAG: metallophosphoesterase [Bacteroidales bacterium]|nr:metallophosphoesterase [Bacteroidales bacterium]